MKPILQVALDFDNLSRALKLASEAMAGGADWLEAGTPLIKSEGLNAVRALRRSFPAVTLVADMKTLDAGRMEMEMAAKAGANIAVVMAAASEATLRECCEAGRNYGIQVAVDILNVQNPVEAARLAEACGAHHVSVHLPVDEQMQGRDPFDLLRKVRNAVRIPVAVAGGLNSETAPKAVEAGADIVIVGGAVTKSRDACDATRTIKRAIESLEAIPSDLFKRVTEENIREILEKVSTANVSDAGHRLPGLAGLRPIAPGMKTVGPALTVRTYPGDWAKPVEALDRAAVGQVIVVDAGGQPPAVWGELATNSAVQRKVAGLVVWGAVRDVADILELRFPVFAAHVCPNAGEPKGFGEIGVPIRIAGVTIETDDWVVADDDGVMVLPRLRAVELANRAMDCLERENRLREEIVSGRSTLSQVMELLRWEKSQ